MNEVRGYVVYETLAMPIINFNLGSHLPAEARMLVAAGKKRWAYCQGGVLTLVDLDYQLCMWENFAEYRCGRIVLLD